MALPAFEQGHERLAAVVGAVESGQVGDLQGHEDEADPAATKSMARPPVVRSRVNPSVKTEEPASEKAVTNGPLQSPQPIKVKPKTAIGQPRGQLQHEGHGLRDGQDAVEPVEVRASRAIRTKTRRTVRMGSDTNDRRRGER